METKKKIYEIIFLFVLVSVALVIFAINPLINDIKASSDEILSDRAQVLFIDDENRELNLFKRDYKDYQTNFAKADQLLVDSKNPINFIKFLEKIASESQITTDINLVPVSSDISGGVVPRMFFKVHARGDFLDMLVFFKKMEMGQYLVTVDTLRMTKFEKEGAQAPADPKNKRVNIPSDKVDADFSINVLSDTPHL
jgi:hypothetical protein